jgi:hypothetical protein
MSTKLKILRFIDKYATFIALVLYLTVMLAINESSILHQLKMALIGMWSIGAIVFMPFLYRLFERALIKEHDKYVEKRMYFKKLELTEIEESLF